MMHTSASSPYDGGTVESGNTLNDKMTEKKGRDGRKCCCCLPTPMTLASEGSPMFPLVVHQPASPSIRPAV